jgi:hypothetical protein
MTTTLVYMFCVCRLVPVGVYVSGLLGRKFDFGKLLENIRIHIAAFACRTKLQFVALVRRAKMPEGLQRSEVTPQGVEMSSLVDPHHQIKDSSSQSDII